MDDEFCSNDLKELVNGNISRQQSILGPWNKIYIHILKFRESLEKGCAKENYLHSPLKVGIFFF
jgi:hypothetical protein